MKIKILFCMTRYYRGGTERVAINLVNNLDKNKFDITILTLSNDGGFEKLLKPHIKKIYLTERYHRGTSKILNSIPSQLLYKYLVKDKYDVEIAIGDGLSAKLIAHSSNKESKKLCWIHMDVTKRGTNLKEYQTIEGRKQFYESFNQIICVSEDCKKSFNKKFGHKEKTSVKYNPLEVDNIILKSKEKLDVHFKDNQLNFISVGRLVEQKGYDRLIEVHKMLIDDGIYHNIYVIGEGREREALEKNIKKYNVEDSFYLLGFKENPYKYIKEADAFICSSRDEAFSTVLSESIILETPIITTECSGTKELLGDSEYGIVVLNTREALYCGLRNLILNPEKIEYYRKMSRKRKEFFDLNKSIEEWEQLLYECKEEL